MKFFRKTLLICVLGLGAASCQSPSSPSSGGGGPSGEGGESSPPPSEEGGLQDLSTGGAPIPPPPPLPAGGVFPGSAVAPPPPPPMPVGGIPKAESNWRTRVQPPEASSGNAVAAPPPYEKPRGALTLTADMLKKRLRGMREAPDDEVEASSRRGVRISGGGSTRVLMAKETRAMITGLSGGEKLTKAKKKELKQSFKKDPEALYKRMVELASQGSDLGPMMALSSFSQFLSLENSSFTKSENEKRVQASEKALKRVLGAQFSLTSLKEYVDDAFQFETEKKEMMFSNNSEDDSSESEEWSFDGED